MRLSAVLSPKQWVSSNLTLQFFASLLDAADSMYYRNQSERRRRMSPRPRCNNPRNPFHSVRSIFFFPLDESRRQKASTNLTSFSGILSALGLLSLKLKQTKEPSPFLCPVKVYFYRRNCACSAFLCFEAVERLIGRGGLMIAR
ncbi:hypothetical protein LX36DRAFT_450248 [Colletotrichum falcatum]|nr:hypothetical protein LX36DRAFT_450248 [Colletotrichum falcatum]